MIMGKTGLRGPEALPGDHPPEPRGPSGYIWQPGDIAFSLLIAGL